MAASAQWLVVVVVGLVLLAEVAVCCKGGTPPPPSPRPAQEAGAARGVSVRDIDVAKDEEDDEDETVEDIDFEADFDLICDGHVEPERVKRTPDVIIFGSKKGGTRALIEFLKLNPKVAGFTFGHALTSPY